MNKRTFIQRARGAAYTAITKVTGGIHPDAMRLEYFIALFEGKNPLALEDPPGRKNPILSRKAVRDITCGFVADPFLTKTQEGWFLFFEAYNWAVHRGEIGLATSPDGRSWKYEGIVLREGHHLSYPFVFVHDGSYYMVPESGQFGCVQLYRAGDFLRGWRVVKTLINEPLADATLFQHDGRWWMYACSAVATHDELKLFFADDVTGPWLEHPASPIVRQDPRRARPAGRVFSVEGRLYRLAQDCEPAYGTAVRAFEVQTLTPEHYTEIEYRSNPILGPGAARWNSAGMHHMDAMLQDDGSWIAAVDGWANYRDGE